MRSQFSPQQFFFDFAIAGVFLSVVNAIYNALGRLYAVFSFYGFYQYKIPLYISYFFDNLFPRLLAPTLTYSLCAIAVAIGVALSRAHPAQSACQPPQFDLPAPSPSNQECGHCPSCGAPIEPGSTFCGGCGKRL